MIIDAHQHFWDKDRFHYPWLTPALGCLYRNFLPSDLQPQLEKSGVAKTVVVQAMASLEETRFLLELADGNEFIAGVVGWVPLGDNTLAVNLEELCRNRKFKGVRHQVEDEEKRDWLLQEEVLRGLSTVAAFGLSFDALLGQDQLWQLEAVCERAEGLSIVLDHAAKPDIAGGEYQAWAAHMKRVARLPILCKMSGLLTEADHAHWTIDGLRRYAECILECFGADRVMFGSDWPVSTQAADYETSVRTAETLLSMLSAAQREMVMYANARKFYCVD